jgi:hypothetical protein
VSDPARTPCSELPNDNPGLHRGAVCFVAEVTGSPVFERAQAECPVPAASDADEEGDDIEIVDELAFDAVDESMVDDLAFDAVDESMVDGPADPFATLVSLVEDVARTAGADDGAMATLARLLGRGRLEDSDDASSRAMRAQALAWQGILRSESDDFGACGGAMLDEWCGALIATVIGRTARADVLKRELRRRGVAAFGLVEQAA